MLEDVFVARKEDPDVMLVKEQACIFDGVIMNFRCRTAILPKKVKAWMREPIQSRSCYVKAASA